MIKLIAYITKHLINIHKGSFLAKIKSTLSLSFSVSPIAYITEKITDWTLENQAYVLFVFGAIFIDHVLGTIIHALVTKDFSLKKNALGLITKVGLVVAVGFLFEGINYIVQEDSFIKSYTIIVLRLSVFLYPAGSAFMNSSILTKGKFPPIGWIKKIKNFEVNMNLDEFKNDKER